MYLLRISNYVVDTEEQEKILGVAYDIFKNCNALPDALRVAMKLDSHELISGIFAACEDELLRKQLGLILSSQKYVLEEFEEDDEMMEIIGNAQVSSNLLIYAFTNFFINVLFPYSSPTCSFTSISSTLLGSLTCWTRRVRRIYTRRIYPTAIAPDVNHVARLTNVPLILMVVL